MLSCRSRSRKCRRDGSCLCPTDPGTSSCRNAELSGEPPLFSHTWFQDTLGGHIFGCWCTHANASQCFSFLRHMRILTDLPACLASEKKGEKNKNASLWKQTIFSGREVLQVLFSCHRKIFFSLCHLPSLRRSNESFPHLLELWRSLNTLLYASIGVRLATPFIAEETIWEGDTLKSEDGRGQK